MLSTNRQYYQLITTYINNKMFRNEDKNLQANNQSLTKNCMILGSPPATGIVNGTKQYRTQDQWFLNSVLREFQGDLGLDQLDKL